MASSTARASQGLDNTRSIPRLSGSSRRCLHTKSVLHRDLLQTSGSLLNMLLVQLIMSHREALLTLKVQLSCSAARTEFQILPRMRSVFPAQAATTFHRSTSILGSQSEKRYLITLFQKILTLVQAIMRPILRL